MAKPQQTQGHPLEAGPEPLDLLHADLGVDSVTSSSPRESTAGSSLAAHSENIGSALQSVSTGLSSNYSLPTKKLSSRSSHSADKQGVDTPLQILSSGTPSSNPSEQSDSPSSTRSPTSHPSTDLSNSSGEKGSRQGPHGTRGKGATYRIGKQLAKGGFGRVLIAMDPSGSLVAIKEIEVTGDKDKCKSQLDQLKMEVQTLRQLQHKNMVTYITSEKVKDNVFHIVMEYVPGGSILKLLDQFGPLSPPVVSRFTRDIVSCLAYIHTKKIVHRDVKCANVLVDVEGTAKVADFGAAEEILKDQHFSKMRRGTVFWMPPEAASGSVSPATDIWCLGCTVMEMFTANPPWWHMGCHSQEQVKDFLSRTGEEYEIDLLSMPDDAKGFMKRCLRRNPNDRPSAEELLDDAFLLGADYAAFGHGSPGDYNDTPIHRRPSDGPSEHNSDRIRPLNSNISLDSLRSKDFQYVDNGPQPGLQRSDSKVSLLFREVDSVYSDSRASSRMTTRHQGPGASISSVLVVGPSSPRRHSVASSTDDHYHVVGSAEHDPAYHEPPMAQRVKRLRKALVAEAFGSYNDLIEVEDAADSAAFSVTDIHQIMGQALKMDLTSDDSSSREPSGTGQALRMVPPNPGDAEAWCQPHAASSAGGGILNEQELEEDLEEQDLLARKTRSKARGLSVALIFLAAIVVFGSIILLLVDWKN